MERILISRLYSIYGTFIRGGGVVILIDFLDAPPALPYVDIHIKESTLDKDAVLEVARMFKAELVISLCVDQANAVCCAVAENLGLPRPYTYKTALNVTVKSRMKSKMIENHIRTPQYITTKSTEIKWDTVHFPAVVKPVDCNSSKGVSKINDISLGRKALQDALMVSRSREACVEDFIDGTEIQVDCFVSEGGQVTILLTREKKPIKNSNGLNSVGSLIPSTVCKERNREILAIAKKIAECFLLRNTLFFYQAIIDKTGNIYVLEFAPRIGGGLSYWLLKNITGVDAIELGVCSFLGRYADVVPHVSHKIWSTTLLYMDVGVFGHIKGLNEAKSLGIIKEFFIYKNRGAVIGSKLVSGFRVGAFVVEADTMEELRKKELLAYNMVDVIDINGCSKMRK